MDSTPQATTPSTPNATTISKVKNIQAINGVNITQDIINILTQMVVAIMAIIARIPHKTIPSTKAMDSRIKNIAPAIPVQMRQIEVPIPETKHIMVRNNEMEIIRKVNPAHPKASIANANANIVNPNRHRSMAVTIPVSPMQIIESEIHRAAKAKNVIVRARQIIHKAKNGMLVHITHKRALRQNAREQRRHALADRHNVRRASTRAVMPRQIIINPSIIQIQPPHGSKQHPKKNVSSPRDATVKDRTIQVNERHIMQMQNAILRQIEARTPQINIMMVVTKHRTDNARANTISPHKTTDRAKQATSKLHGSVNAHSVPNMQARQIMDNERTIICLACKTDNGQ